MKTLTDAENDVMCAVNFFLKEKGFHTRCDSFFDQRSIEVVNRGGDKGLPVTVKFQFMDGDFVGILAGTVDLFNDLIEHMDEGGGLKLKMSSHIFEVGDPKFFDHILEFTQSPYKFLESV